MRDIKKDDLNGDTPAYVLLEYLRGNIQDIAPRENVDSFELGKKAGQLEVIDMIQGVIGK